MRFPDENGNGGNPEVIALRALAWVMGEQTRADRLLALTGLDVSQLRARADDPAIWVATLEFLAAHEPDLIACAEALDLPPERLMAYARELGR